MFPKMASSYLLFDEDMCFFDKGEGMMTKSESILEVGVARAMQQVKWDRKSFVECGGIHDWGKDKGSYGQEAEKGLEW